MEPGAIGVEPEHVTVSAGPPHESAPQIAPIHVPLAEPMHVPPGVLLQPAAPPARTGSGALWVAILALLFAAGATFVLDDHVHTLAGKQEAVEKTNEKLNSALAAADRRAASAEETVRDLEKRLGVRIDAQKTRYTTLEEDARQIRQKQDLLAAQLTEVAKVAGDLQQKSGAPSVELERRLAEISSRVAKSEDEARGLREQIAVLEAAQAAAPAPEAAAEPAKPAEAAWKATIPDLSSPNESVRWEAVTTLGATNDKEVVPYIVPMLKDANVFVRMAAARMLGNLQAKSAVGALIDALEDVEAAVREQAFVAVRAITSKDLKFDPLANEGERSKRVKAWREWWKKESETPSGT
jgi:HEAT repeat protein